MEDNDIKDNVMESQSLTRRQMLQAAAGAGVVLALAGCNSTGRQTSAMEAPVPAPSLSVNLTGDAWSMHEEGSSETIPAIVPGATYTDLMRAKKIPNPYYREDNGKVQWVADKNWIYKRSFHVSADMLAKPQVELKCHGLDTLATVWINDKLIGQTDNMFRAWTFEVKEHLRTGNNTIRIKFDTLTPYVEKNRAAYKKEYGIDLSDARCWVRKAPYMWGWDWCRAVLTQGIWKPIEIVAFDSQIADVAVFQHHHESGAVHLDIQTSVRGANSGAHVSTRVMYGDQVVATASAPVADGMAKCRVEVTNPQLWWPNGMGEHPLYTVQSQLEKSAGAVVELLSNTPGTAAGVIDTATRRIGLRKIEVLPPKDGLAMHVQVNGVPVFVKGADWIPADNIPTRVTPETIRWYMKKAIECNFNFIRLWGGGYYEQDELFDLCDELGIMLQFEFKFANDTYPVNDKKWMANLQTELDQQVRRCRNHPSIVIWSGNNEIQDFKGYYHLFGDVIGGTVHRLLPGAFYEVGSGASGSGDIHTWNVWFGMKPFESYNQVHGFVTEFGMQSWPVPKTVRAYTDKADRSSVLTPVMRYHEMSKSGPGGIGRMTHYMTEYFGSLPKDMDHVLWLSQIMQAYGIGYGVQHWRLDMPHSMAATIWQYNDCWPGPTWSMVDWYRRSKTLLFQSRHFFAPILVAAEPDAKTGRADIFIVSDKLTPCDGQLTIHVTDLAGQLLHERSLAVHIPARTSRVAVAMDLSAPVKKHGAANLIIWARIRVGAVVVAQNMLLFTRPLELKLPKPNISALVSQGAGGYLVTLESREPALWTWVDLTDTDADYSDNFIHLRPSEPVVILVRPAKAMAPMEFHRKLRVQSVVDVAPDMRAPNV